MFGWMKKKGADVRSELRTGAIEKHFDKVIRFFESEALQNSLQPEERRAVILSGLNCDKIPGGHGEFGRVPTNPIPVNGPTGQILYLSQLRTITNSPIMFHRVGSTQVGDAYIDMYEVLSIDDGVREYLYLSLYHPRKSRICPTGYRIESKVDWDNPAFGVNFLVANFPHQLDERIRDWHTKKFTFSLSVNKVRKYLYGNAAYSITPRPNPITWNGRKREQRDATGLCFNCWAVKQSFVAPCERCGRRPEREDEAIYSIALSGVYYDPLSLNTMSEYIISGQRTASLSLEQMDELRPAAQAMLARLNPLFKGDDPDR